jgi:thioredoxin reductase (NADPH)
MAQPAFLLLIHKARVRDVLSADLDRRFGRDYTVLSASNPDEAFDTLERLAAQSVEVALLIVDQEVVDAPTAPGFLMRARALCPGAKRIMLVPRGDWSATHPVVSAMALGRIDFHLFSPWRPLERNLYPAIAEFLAAWDKSSEPSAVAMRIVADPGAPSTHELRDILTRIAVPFWVYDVNFLAGRDVLAEVGVDSSRLPVILLFD